MSETTVNSLKRRYRYNIAREILERSTKNHSQKYIICNCLCGSHNNYNKLSGRPPQYAPAPCKLTFDLESGVRVTCDVGYLCANFSLPRPLCSRLRADIRDRQTSSDTHHRLMFRPMEAGA